MAVTRKHQRPTMPATRVCSQTRARIFRFICTSPTMPSAAPTRIRCLRSPLNCINRINTIIRFPAKVKRNLYRVPPCAHRRLWNFPLVPKFHLGTLSLWKFHFSLPCVPRFQHGLGAMIAKSNFARYCVPKWNLGTSLRTVIASEAKQSHPQVKNFLWFPNGIWEPATAPVGRPYYKKLLSPIFDFELRARARARECMSFV